MTKVKVLSILSLALLSASCTWVKLSSEGRTVNILSVQELVVVADSCTKVGGTSVSVLDKVVLSRSPAKVAQELATLARNQAASRGNTLVSTSAVIDGKQDFDIYLCGVSD